jgi:hypothetical protein
MTSLRFHIKSSSLASVCLTLLLMMVFTGALQAQEEEPVTDTVVAPVADSASYDTTYTETAEMADEDEEGSEYQLVPGNPNTIDSAVLRQVPDTAVQRLQALKEFEYANDPEYWVREKKEPLKERKARTSTGFWEAFYDFFDRSIVKMIFYTVLIILVLFGIYRVVVVNKLYMSYSAKAALDEGGETEVDMDHNTLEQAISNAIKQGNYRLAVRYLYIRSLRALNDRGWIRYHAQATNYDYLQQLKGQPLQPEFRFLTQVYDYVWYGEFPLNAEQFTGVQHRFNQFFTQVK